MDYVIGAMTDYELKDIEPWVSSLVKSGFQGQKVMLIYNARKGVVDFLSDLDFEIWMVGRDQSKDGYEYFFTERQNFNICVERFFHVWKFLKDKKEVEAVLLTDVKDVVFQQNPINYIHHKFWMEELKETESLKTLMVTSENIRYRDEPWGAHNLLHSFGTKMFEHMQANEIYNAGVISGYSNSFSDFMLSIYMAAKSTGKQYVDGGGGPDQAAMNLLLSLDTWKEITHFTIDFAAQAGTTNDPSKLEIFKDKWINELMIPHLQIDKKILTDTGVINNLGHQFPVVHQYDRVPEWNEYFKKRFTYEAMKQ